MCVLLCVAVFGFWFVCFLKLEGYKSIATSIDPRFFLGPDWDLYIVTLLILLLGILIVLRRHR